MEAINLAVATVQSAAPASAAWAQLDVGLGLKSGVILMIFIGSLAAVLRDRQTHSGTLFGVFFTALITTIAAVQVVIRPLVEDPPSQAIIGLFLAYNAQKWAGKATKAALKKFTDKAGSEPND